MRTYSLIFDTEQLGCVRFGIPRIRKVLEKQDVKATFFVTGFVAWVYPEMTRKLGSLGEIGLHGDFHESLKGLSMEQQVKSILSMKSKFNTGVRGVNLIGRMDSITVRALAKCGVEYFVSDNVTRFTGLRFSLKNLLPILHKFPEGSIWELPVSIETYNYPWLTIQNALDFVDAHLQRLGYAHLTILCHPFRDGSLHNVSIISRIIDRMKRKGYSPITLEAHLSELRDKWVGGLGIRSKDTLPDKRLKLAQLALRSLLHESYVQLRRNLAYMKGRLAY